MELFNEYCNSEMQFLLDLFSLDRPFSDAEAIALAKEAHVFAPYNNYEEILKKWAACGLIEKAEGKQYRVCRDPKLYAFAAPPNALELEYLSDICHTREASLFLQGDIIRKLGLSDATAYDSIRRQNTTGKNRESGNVHAGVFQSLIKAMHEKRRIEYQYCTNNDATIREGTGIPYRLEYSVFDGRWWLISYNSDQDRTIKSRLENIKEVRLKEKHGIKDAMIRDAIMRHLSKEPVILYIDNIKNGLERCFLVFEDMLDMTAYDLGNEKYELRFLYFDWDSHVIVRKLLYLGESVVLQSPAALKNEVLEELKLALSTNAQACRLLCT